MSPGHVPNAVHPRLRARPKVHDVRRTREEPANDGQFSRDSTVRFDQRPPQQRARPRWRPLVPVLHSSRVYERTSAVAEDERPQRGKSLITVCRVAFRVSCLWRNELEKSVRSGDAGWTIEGLVRPRPPNTCLSRWIRQVSGPHQNPHLLRRTWLPRELSYCGDVLRL